MSKLFSTCFFNNPPHGNVNPPKKTRWYPFLLFLNLSERDTKLCKRVRVAEYRVFLFITEFCQPWRAASPARPSRFQESLCSWETRQKTEIETSSFCLTRCWVRDGVLFHFSHFFMASPCPVEEWRWKEPRVSRPFPRQVKERAGYANEQEVAGSLSSPYFRAPSFAYLVVAAAKSCDSNRRPCYPSPPLQPPPTPPLPPPTTSQQAL